MVSALGYFVDIYDLILFSIVRIPSLKAIGVPSEELLGTGVFLLNMQMFGMLLGGILWGVFGDKRGRVSVLFGSIFLYSAANIANGFVQSVPMYGALRLLAGIGLAGELGAAITLVSETLSKEKRGYGTTIVASVGILGAVAAAWVGDYFDWRVAYFVGGAMGLALLVMRVSMFESGMFEGCKQAGVRRGDFTVLFRSLRHFKRYASCILIGVPVWYVIGILITFSPELSTEMGVTGPIQASLAVMWSYIGLAAGDVASGFLSQWLRTRKRVVLGFLSLTAVLTCVYVYVKGWTPFEFYGLCAALGFAVGYWAVFVTVAAEHFGTNLRSTVTTSTPNFVRGSVVVLTLAFQSLRQSQPLLQSALIVGIVALAAAFLGLRGLDETYGKELDYVD